MDKGDSDVCGGHRSCFSLPGHFLRFLQLGSDLTRARFFKFFSICACAVQSSDRFRRAKPRSQRNSDSRFFFQAECVWGCLRTGFQVGSEFCPDSTLRIKMVKSSPLWMNLGLLVAISWCSVPSLVLEYLLGTMVHCNWPLLALESCLESITVTGGY